MNKHFSEIRSSIKMKWSLLKDWVSRKQRKFKKFLNKVKINIKSFFEWILTIDADFLFVLLFSFIIQHDYSILERLAFSIGIVYVYKYLLVKYLIKILASVK